MGGSIARRSIHPTLVKATDKARKQKLAIARAQVAHTASEISIKSFRQDSIVHVEHCLAQINQIGMSVM